MQVKTMRKRIAAICCGIISLFTFGACDLLGMLPGGGTPTDGNVIDGVTYALSEDGKSAKVVDYEGDGTNVWVKSEFQGVPVTRIENDAFALSGVLSVNLPDSITSIGYEAFFCCTRLKEIAFPQLLTAIGGSAFEMCGSLVNVEIPNLVKTIGRKAFAKCSSLTYVQIGREVSYIGQGAFENSRALNQVVFVEQSGWQVNDVVLAASSLEDAAMAARLLRSEYRRYTWERL